MSDLWKYFDVELEFRNRIVGGVPKSPDTMKSWLKTRTGLEGDNLAAIVTRTATEMGRDTLTDDEETQLLEAAWQGFKQTPEGPYVESRQVKAMLKEAANVVKKILNVANMKARVAERVFVYPDIIQMGVAEVSGTDERPIHVMTARGPRTSLKRFDYVDRPRLLFSLKVLDEVLVTLDKKRLTPATYLPVLLEYGGENGMGADRSQGNGQFDVTRFEVKTV